MGRVVITVTIKILLIFIEILVAYQILTHSFIVYLELLRLLHEIGSRGYVLRSHSSSKLLLLLLIMRHILLSSPMFVLMVLIVVLLLMLLRVMSKLLHFFFINLLLFGLSLEV